MMNFNHLALFHAVSEEGSISAGADRLAISQPAVSKQLGELERMLDVRLFDRLPRGVRLTEAGALLADYARRLFSLAAEAERALNDLRGLERGQLAIGASTTIGSYWLPDILTSFHRAYPGIEINLEIANTEVIQHHLLAGTLEVGLTEGFVENDELEAEVFHVDELVGIAPLGHPLARERSVSLKRFCQEPFLVREKGSGTRSVIERELARKGVKVQPAMALGGTEAIKQAVAAGAGVALVSRLAVGSECEVRRFTVVVLSDLSLRRPLHRIQQRGRHPSHALRAFLALLEKQEQRC